MSKKSRRHGRDKRGLQGNKCVDFAGKQFVSESAMCRYWGIARHIFSSRINSGWSLKDALTTPVGQDTEGNSIKNKSCVDHLGNEYPSVGAMLKAYGVSSGKYYSGLKKGLSLEEVLNSGPANPSRTAKPCVDHLGNEYPSIGAMLKVYGVSSSKYYDCLKKDIPLKDILTSKTEKARNAMSIECKDHLGNEYASISEMCRAWGITKNQYRYGTDHRRPLKETLLRGGREFPILNDEDELVALADEKTQLPDLTAMAEMVKDKEDISPASLLERQLKRQEAMSKSLFTLPIQDDFDDIITAEVAQTTETLAKMLRIDYRKLINKAVLTTMKACDLNNKPMESVLNDLLGADLYKQFSEVCKNNDIDEKEALVKAVQMFIIMKGV